MAFLPWLVVPAVDVAFVRVERLQELWGESVLGRVLASEACFDDVHAFLLYLVRLVYAPSGQFQRSEARIERVGRVARHVQEQYLAAVREADISLLGVEVASLAFPDAVDVAKLVVAGERRAL